MGTHGTKGVDTRAGFGSFDQAGQRKPGSKVAASASAALLSLLRRLRQLLRPGPQLLLPQPLF